MGAVSAKTADMGVLVVEAGRVRLRDCRKDEKRDAPEGVICGCGDGGMVEGDCVATLATALLAGADVDIFVGGCFFLGEVKDRRNDHSDSNWSDSNSAANGEWSRSATSR